MRLMSRLCGGTCEVVHGACGFVAAVGAGAEHQHSPIDPPHPRSDHAQPALLGAVFRAMLDGIGRRRWTIITPGSISSPASRTPILRATWRVTCPIWLTKN